MVTAHWVRGYEGDTKFANATVRDGYVIASEVAVRGRIDTFELGSLIGMTEDDLAARGFRQTSMPNYWDDLRKRWTGYDAYEQADEESRS